MAQTYLTNLDLNKNQLLNAALQNLASDPSSPVAGQVYFNTTDNVFKIYDGTQWVDLQAGDISAVVAGTGLSGGGTSGSVTVDLADTAVTAGSAVSLNPWGGWIQVSQQRRELALTMGLNRNQIALEHKGSNKRRRR